MRDVYFHLQRLEQKSKRRLDFAFENQGNRQLFPLAGSVN